MRRPTPPSKKRCSRCRLPTASSTCTAVRRSCTRARSSRSAASSKKVDASIASIRDGKFLKALAREEIKQDPDWVIQLRALPESPETYYLMELMASNDFQTALQNYLDLDDLRRKLASWDVELRRVRRHDRVAPFDYYEPRLPEVDHDFRDARLANAPAYRAAQAARPTSPRDVRRAATRVARDAPTSGSRASGFRRSRARWTASKRRKPTRCASGSDACRAC